MCYACVISGECMCACVMNVLLVVNVFVMSNECVISWWLYV